MSPPHGLEPGDYIIVNGEIYDNSYRYIYPHNQLNDGNYYFVDGEYFIDDNLMVWKFIKITNDNYKVYGLYNRFIYNTNNQFIKYLNIPTCNCGKCGMVFESDTLN